jgi:uncharacterized protein YbjT (DUF2867 family)
MSRHVVFGAGQVGRHLVAGLVAEGVDTVADSRSGHPVAGATVVAGDASDTTFTTATCAGADVVYCCLNADYRRWPEEFPPLQAGVLAGAAAAGARLVVLENLTPTARRVAATSSRPCRSTRPPRRRRPGRP